MSRINLENSYSGGQNIINSSFGWRCVDGTTKNNNKKIKNKLLIIAKLGFVYHN